MTTPTCEWHPDFSVWRLPIPSPTRPPGSVCPAPATRPRSPNSWSGTGRWCSASVAECSATPTRLRTPSRPPFLRWPVTPVGSDRPTRWPHGSMGQCPVSLKARGITARDRWAQRAAASPARARPAGRDYRPRTRRRDRRGAGPASRTVPGGRRPLLSGGAIARRSGQTARVVGRVGQGPTGTRAGTAKGAAGAAGHRPLGVLAGVTLEDAARQSRRRCSADGRVRDIPLGLSDHHRVGRGCGTPRRGVEAGGRRRPHVGGRRGGNHRPPACTDPAPRLQAGRTRGGRAGGSVRRPTAGRGRAPPRNQPAAPRQSLLTGLRALTGRS